MSYNFWKSEKYDKHRQLVSIYEKTNIITSYGEFNKRKYVL